VSIDYLLGVTDIKKAPAEAGAEMEAFIINTFAGLSDSDKNKAMDYFQMLVTSSKHKNT
jgi:hypothetical protein